MILRILYIVLITILLSQYSFAQKIKPFGSVFYVNNYTRDDYSAGTQNWDIEEDSSGVMYFANKVSSVLMYDGTNWQQIPVPNTTTVYSLHKGKNQVIYLGAENQFGFLEHKANNELYFKSLLDKLPDTVAGIGKVWQVQEVDKNTIVYMTDMYLLLYDYGTDSLSIITSNSISDSALFLRMFKVGDELFFSVKYKGLYRFSEGTLKFLPGSKDLWRAMVFLPYRDGIIISTWDKGFFYYVHGRFIHTTTPLEPVATKNIYKAIVLKGGYYAFSLKDKHGVLITDTSLTPIQYININDGLYNDNVNNLYQDSQGNLWLALDNGIANIYLYSAFTKFLLPYGFTQGSKTYTVAWLDDILYVANSNKLYAGQFSGYENKLKGINKFVALKSERGGPKTYNLKLVDSELIGSGDFGFYKVKGDSLKYLSENVIIRTFVRLQSNPDVIIGAADALFRLMRDSSGRWRYYGNIDGFKRNVKTICEDTLGYVWISDRLTGVYRLKFNKDYSKVTEITAFAGDSLHGLPSHKKNNVYRVGDRVLIATLKGVYYYNYQDDYFYPDTAINNALEDTLPITSIVGDFKGNIWLKQEKPSGVQKTWELIELVKTPSGYQGRKALFYPLRNNIYSFTPIDSNQYIIGTVDGFVHYDASVEEKVNAPYRVYINKVRIIGRDSVLAYMPQVRNEPYQIDYKFNSLRFVFGANYYKFPQSVVFSTYLEGNDDDWSEWAKESFKDYSNLRPGTYTLYVKAKNLYGIESEVATYNFVIKPPWYLTYWAFVIYFAVAALLVWLIVYLYTLRLRKQKEYLEKLVKQRTVEIEKQKEQIEQQRDILVRQNEEIQMKNKDITSSIEYAKRIQTAILPLEENIKQYLPEHFIFFKPRDIVSGDFYWFAHKDGKSIIAAVDCTGHGVPGAFMSMIGYEILNTIVINHGITDPAEILNMQNYYVRKALKQDTTDNQDGMDMTVCVISDDKKTVEFAGAKNPLIYIMGDKLHKIRGDRQSIGGYQYTDEVNFTKHTIEVESPAWFYIFSDGFQDQFGGDPPKKFMAKYFYDFLFQIHTYDMEHQKDMLEQRLNEWKQGGSQTDDILIIGFKL